MALIVCTECGKSFSDKARQCPECGCPIQFSLNDSDTVFIQDGSGNDIMQQPSVRYDLIDKIVSQIRMLRSNYQNNKKENIIFCVDDWTFSYRDADRLFIFLYKIFHNETDKLLKKYKDSFLSDVKAVNIWQITACETALEKCDASRGEVDPRPFASEFMYKIDEYRKENEDEEVSVAGIGGVMETAIEHAGKIILEKLEKDYSIAPSIEPHIKIIIFYFKEIYEDYCQSFSGTLKEYILMGQDLNLVHDIQNKYYFNGDCFEKYSEYYANDSEDIVTQAKAEIKWRKEYLKNLEKIKPWESLADDMEQLILFLIQCMNEKCDFGMNPDYYNWSSYKKQKRRLSSINSIQTELEKKAILKKIFLKFPFNSDVYPYLLEVYGDKNGEVSKLLTELNVNVTALKKALLERYVEDVYAKIDWKNADTIMEAYEKINSKREFLVYEGKNTDQYNKIQTEYNEYKKWEDILERKSVLGIQAICGLLESKAGIPNDAESEKLKKGLNISNDIIVYFAHDDTIFKNGKHGFAITNKGFFVRNMFKKSVFYRNESLIGDCHTYKVVSGGVLVDDKLLFQFTGDSVITNKLYIAAKYIIPLITSDDEIKEENQKKFCVFCGKKINISSKFCQFCGKKNTDYVN